MSDRKTLPGKFVWFELVTGEPKKAQAFYAEVLGWRTQAFPMGPSTYEMIYAGDTMLGGYATPAHDQTSHWISYVSVDDVDAAAKVASAKGGKIVQPATDIPTVGRMARIADPQGAEICLFKNSDGDPPDLPKAPQGTFFWNELHTPHPTLALAFYEAVVGYAHRSMDMGPAGAYHIISKGGVDRGGVTHHLPPGVPPHWLPYVSNDDVDAAIARAKRLGARIPINPEDIPGVGRFGVLQDPTGAVLALMKPLPRDNPT